MDHIDTNCTLVVKEKEFFNIERKSIALLWIN